MAADEARQLLDAIETDTLLGLRDRALIALMTYTFARVGAVIHMRVEDYYIQGRKSWVQLREKGSKLHHVPCHHRLDEYLHAYIERAGVSAAEEFIALDGFVFAACRFDIRHPDNDLWEIGSLISDLEDRLGKEQASLLIAQAARRNQHLATLSRPFSSGNARLTRKTQTTNPGFVQPISN